MERVIQARVMLAGEADAPLLWSDQPLSFWGGYAQATGVITDQRHPLCGRSAAGCALAIPYTVGSSTTTAVLLEALRAGTAPAAILTRQPDTYVALAAIVAEEMYGRTIPILAVAGADFDELRHAARVVVRRDGAVTVI
jgi:predicted aconitase with swiveling domain